MKENSLSVRIIKIGKSGKAVGMPKSFSAPRNREARLRHIEICKKLVELSESNENYALTALVYFADGKNAQRIPVFEQGYPEFDEKKAKTILKWLKMFAKHHENAKMFRNANIAHALCRFYDKYSKSTTKFKAALEASTKDSTISTFKDAAESLRITKETESLVLAVARA